MNNRVITAISQTKRGRFSLEIDGEFAFSISADELLEYGIFRGMVMSQFEIEDLRRVSGIDRCKAKAAMFLSLRDHSTGELIQKLTRTFDIETSQMVVDELVSDGLVDNFRFGILWAKELFEVRMYGPLRVRNELIKRGLSKEETNDVLSELELDYERNCETAIDIKYPNWETQKEKVIRGMYAMGYPAAMTCAAMREKENSENIYD